MEQLQMKEALVITYSNETGAGRIGLKMDNPEFESAKEKVLTKLAEQKFNIKTDYVLYVNDDEL